MEETLGKRIAANRKRLALTQDALAEQLGVTAQAVSKWENDQSCPDIAMLPKLAEIFETTTDELLGIAPRIVHPGEVVSPQEESDGDDPEHDGAGWEFRWESGRKDSIRAAVLVLLVGGLLLASKLLDWDVTFLGILWPSSLLIFGIFGLWPKFSFFKAGCALFGCYFLISNLGILTISLGSEVFFPVLILLFGLSLLGDALKKPKKPMMHFHLNRKGKQKTECSTKDETFQCTQSFGENSHYISLSQLSGGEVSCSFGELTVDLSGCETVSEHCRIEVCCSFGETVILVPSHFLAETNISTFCGNYTICGTPSADPVGTILFTGDASFGEIKIRYI